MLTLLDGVLADLGLGDVAGPRLVGDPQPAVLASPLAVAECAIGSVAACLAAAAELAFVRTGRRPDIALDTEHVAAAMRSEVWLRDADGRGIDGFAPLSRLWQAADGWVRTHGNYPWHRAALLAALGVPDGRDADVQGQLADAISARPAVEVERIVYAAGGLAVAARTQAQWRADGQPAATGTAPLVGMAPLGRGSLPLSAPGRLPASGVKVLDLTRVIAGPVGTRMLGALGADVLRVDDPHRPELPLHAVEGVIGKASTSLDARTESDRQALHRLLDQADVLVTGYRPGALRRLGLEPDQVADKHPGTIVVTLSAWGTEGAWGTRRGFDSLVQVATGIGWATSTDGGRPGALPCQLLDHATGYLVAAGALAALRRRARTGDATHVSVSLARTAQWLLDQGSTAAGHRADDDQKRRADAYRTALGNGWSAISPPGQLDGRPLSWPHLPPAYASAPPEWS
ncbi:CoA-transferase family III [Micromonospora citrea]|uniref:CoA-transferase family III n=1 Tax=Micromonospora citrea TaxID=47855 RepID=A0A1C6VX46_9ACTN|nr:CoA transferase [Micromonospora citrea]SCL70802.1 CoA-transferase family III [Micromonospora citrea]